MLFAATYEDTEDPVTALRIILSSWARNFKKIWTTKGRTTFGICLKTEISPCNFECVWEHYILYIIRSTIVLARSEYPLCR